jgi:putative polyhydroxyalkanoate system protein
LGFDWQPQTQPCLRGFTLANWFRTWQFDKASAGQRIGLLLRPQWHERFRHKIHISHLPVRFSGICRSHTLNFHTPHSNPMADIHILRNHHFSLSEARDIAFSWAEQAENDFGMACTYEEGDDEDLVTFTRSGVNGTLRVCGERFELDAKLGFLLGAFKERIESEVVKNLDDLMAAHAPKPAKKAKPAPKSAATSTAQAAAKPPAKKAPKA